MSEIVYPGARVTAQSGVRAQAVNRGSVRFWCQDQDPICGQEGLLAFILGLGSGLWLWSGSGSGLRRRLGSRLRLSPRFDGQSLTGVKAPSVAGQGSAVIWVRTQSEAVFLLLGDIVWG